MNADPTTGRKRFQRIDYLWLVYLLFYFIDPFFRHSLVFWLQSIAFAAAMVVLYMGAFRLRQVTLRRLCVLGIFLLGAASYPTNSGAIAFFIYAAALLPFVFVSLQRVVVLLILDAALLMGEGWLLHRPMNSLFGIFFIAVVGGSNIFFAQKMRADCKLRMAHEEIEALAAVAERERIARDLHDVLGHTLSVIALKAELAGRLLAAQTPDVSRAAQEIGDVERTARAALAEVRETIGGYRARGFAAEIEAARNALAAAGVKLELESVPPPGSLRPAEESVLALAVREAVTNVVRHAQAKTCNLRFVTENGHRTLVIEDDGQHASAREGNGLRGMRERVESLGGTLQLQRQHGTRLMIELPAAAGSAS